MERAAVVYFKLIYYHYDEACNEKPWNLSGYAVISSRMKPMTFRKQKRVP